MNRRKLILICALSLGWLLCATLPGVGQSERGKTVAWSDKPVPEVEKPAAPMSATDKAVVALAVSLILAGGIAFRRQAQRIGALLLEVWSDPWSRIDAAAALVADKLWAEESSLAEFFNALRASMNGEVKYSVAEAPD